MLLQAFLNECCVSSDFSLLVSHLFDQLHRHAGMYRMYPDVQAVVHFHAPAVLPFGIVRPLSDFLPNTEDQTIHTGRP